MLHQYQVEIKKAGLLRGGPPKESDSLTDPPSLGPDGSPSSSGNAKGKSRPVQTERGGWIVPLTARDGNEKAPIKMPGQDKFRLSLDMIIKHSLDRIGLKSFGKSPRVFYFDDKIQPSLLGPAMPSEASISPA